MNYSRFRSLALALTLAGCLALGVFPNLRFRLGGVLVHLGSRLQNHVSFHALAEDPTPEAIWQELVYNNSLASTLHSHSTQKASTHPLVALVVCMDARLHVEELLGDTRSCYYVIRTAGSILEEAEMEMLELAVENGVRVIALTTHTDCAAEKVARDPIQSAHYPHISRDIRERQMHIQQLVTRPMIARRLREGKLAVHALNLDTASIELKPWAVYGN